MVGDPRDAGPRVRPFYVDPVHPLRPLVGFHRVYTLVVIEKELHFSRLYRNLGSRDVGIDAGYIIYHIDYDRWVTAG